MITSSKDNHLRNKIDNGAVFSRKINSFSEWKHHMGNRFGRLSVSTREAHFHGRVRSRSIEDATVTEIAASPHQVQRNLCQTSDLEPRLLKLSLLLEGHGLVTQDGRTAALSPGDVAVYDTGKPYSLEFTDDMRVLIMIFPHQMIGLPMKLVSTATAVRLPGDSGIGKVISPFMEHIATNIELLDGINGERILRSALDLISALLSAELTRTATQVDSDQTKIAEIEHFIDRNLGESHLSTRLIATAHYISARKLQYLFQARGETVSSYIRARRLERSRLDLIDPALASLAIQHIALRWGFSDAAHFSRLFKSAFGISPKDYRSEHLKA